ncbi:response regulator transcription factor [Acetobacteraceae bacterium H6797]|nr:response regulator transcription factor [Acetobacteraceae bacterium H6797]
MNASASPLPGCSVLLLEDDQGAAETIEQALVREGYATIRASSLSEATECFEQSQPRIVLVDLGLPDGNGLGFVREVAGRADCAIMVISGRGEEIDRVVGLELGADDYLPKPFSVRELVARVRALQRRLGARSPEESMPAMPVQPPPPTRLEAAGIVLDPERLRVIGTDGQETRLTGAESGLLNLLITSPGRMAERDRIALTVLGHRLQPHQRSVDQLASALRRKIATASDMRIQVISVRGRGYRLVW